MINALKYKTKLEFFLIIWWNNVTVPNQWTMQVYRKTSNNPNEDNIFYETKYSFKFQFKGTVHVW